MAVYDVHDLLAQQSVSASVPCRIDMGGTLDLKTFYLSLHALNPCTFNIALALPTRVTLSAAADRGVHIVSRGFPEAHFRWQEAPFDHPLGLMFAIAAFFQADGLHIDVSSMSPPRSALGGSSAAAVALVAALTVLQKRAQGKKWSRKAVAALAHAIEESIAAVPCGLQDHLAAAYGGVNAWYWPHSARPSDYRRTSILGRSRYERFQKHLLVAYCGQPHSSSDINGQWVKQYLSGAFRREWQQIIALTHQFIDAMRSMDFTKAATCMNAETALRRKMTPGVLDAVGEALVDAAVENNCGARFSGAGGGGCIWALGGLEDIDRLQAMWENLLSSKKEARLLPTTIDGKGLIIRFTNSHEFS